MESSKQIKLSQGKKNDQKKWVDPNFVFLAANVSVLRNGAQSCCSARNSLCDWGQLAGNEPLRSGRHVPLEPRREAGRELAQQTLPGLALLQLRLRLQLPRPRLFLALLLPLHYQRLRHHGFGSLRQTSKLQVRTLKLLTISVVNLKWGFIYWSQFFYMACFFFS